MTAVSPDERDYALIFEDGTKLEFRVGSMTQALYRARVLLPEGRAALLAECGEAIATVIYEPGGFWTVLGPAPEVAWGTDSPLTAAG